jgi:hypothetical protein
MKYRVVESHKGFQIEVLTEFTTGLFTKTKVEKWRIADENGKPFLLIYQIPTFPYKTLDEAKSVIESWKKGKTIHEVD